MIDKEIMILQRKKGEVIETLIMRSILYVEGEGEGGGYLVTGVPLIDSPI